MHEPLCSWTARAHWLKAAAAVALGAVPSECDAAQQDPNTIRAASTVAAVLFDDRIAAVGGREGLPLSCASVYTNLVARFRGGIAHREIHRARYRSNMQLVALTHDVRSMVGMNDESNSLKEFDAATGATKCRAAIVQDMVDDEEGGISYATDIFVAEDGYIFVTSYDQNRAHVFTPFPDAKLHGYVGGFDEEGEKDYIWRANTVCATTDVVLAGGGTWIYKFSRHDVHAPHVELDVGDVVYCIRPLHDGKRAAFLTLSGIGIVHTADLCALERFISFEPDRYNPSYQLYLACSAYDEFIVLASDCDGRVDVTVLEADGTIFETKRSTYTRESTPWAAACSRSTVALVFGGKIRFWG